MDFRVFASKIVHAKLVEAGLVQDGYPSPRTVARWTASGKAPGWVEQAMRDLFGQQKEAAPDWERLLRTVDAIAERIGVNLDEERVAAAAGADAALPPLPGAGTRRDPAVDGRAGAGPLGERGR